ncbi:alkaline phosphatase D family protein [Streptomyces sp. MA5143a]|uniref:alkaline phosphatase D family protein n=1 Tax=Streptomyces sp. MA5143a TaxID=2083010 RepID=UPI000D1BF995|nr:alkaline phosphatase D family protein [Streptomyces sp. MA5143a]SPF05168.1 PhoD-like phosphatase [Streptomyces sp. MA5143a]
MAELRLGPLLRYVDGSTATVWVETSRPCTAEVRCAGGGGGRARTFQISGHHYALVPVTGLTPGTVSSYEVLLDDSPVWPPPDSRFPPSEIHTPAGDDPVRVAFGSCRWAAPPHGDPDPVGPDALDALASRIAAGAGDERPDVLLLLGDQVYADETSKATRAYLASRRDLREPPGAQVADYEEYTHLYYESWLDPGIRWLLSTVPTCMIFDDHDVIDDWNTSASWLADMRDTPWWQERILSGLMSYWVHQHLGNLTPAELAADPVYAAVRAVPDGTDVLRAHATEADRDLASVRWSYRRDFGRVRVLMLDSRAARVLDEANRSMLDAGEAAWLREQALDDPGSCDHLLIGTSLPWLLPHLVHGAESWNAALCQGVRGERWARFGEKVRRAADLEHWAAFPESFEALTALTAEAGSGDGAPATVLVLSGDVHHAYIAQPTWPADAPAVPDARVLQLTCSPVHNSVPLSMKLGFHFGWSRIGRSIGRWLGRHGRGRRPSIDWHKAGGPWFGNQLMTLTLRGRSARLRFEQARARKGEKARLETVTESALTP